MHLYFVHVTCKYRNIDTELGCSNGSGRFNAIAPPSAVVKFSLREKKKR
jgi:hypothetical protein